MSDREDSQNDGRTIHVSQLPGRTKEDEIRDMFATCGKVESCKLIIDPKTGQSRYFAFVTMSTDEAANEAIAKFDQTIVGGRKINVAKAKRGRGRSPTPGEYLGLNKSRGFQRDRYPDRRDRDFDRRERDRDFDRRDKDFERRDDRRDFERRDDRRDFRDRDADPRDSRGFERRDRGFDYRDDRRDRGSPRGERRDRGSPRDEGRDRGYGFERERGLSPRGYAPPPPPRRPYSPNRFDPREDRYRGGSPPRDYEPERIRDRDRDRDRDREQDRDRDRDRRRN